MKNFIDLAADAAEELANEHSNEPELEFLSWLTIALQREAMVSEAYDARFINEQLSAWSEQCGISDEVIEVIREALAFVWVQESAHQAYFEAILKGVRPPKTLVERLQRSLRQVQGRVEGHVLSSISSGNVWDRYPAKLAIVLGSRIGIVPEYVQSLQQEDFAGFCKMNADLEHTAVLGYDRMIMLARMMPDRKIIKDTAVMVDLKRTEKDELYHRTLFRALANWPPPPGGPQAGHAVGGIGQAVQPTASVDGAWELIATAKAYAYGDEAEVLGANKVSVDSRAIAQDPLVLHLRSFAATWEDEEQTGGKMMMMS